MKVHLSSVWHSRELPLAGQGLLMSMTATVLFTVANSLFLTAYGPGHLPMVYLGLALFVPIVSVLYTTLHARLSRVAMACAFSTAAFTACMGGWVAHREGDAPWLGYLLLMAWNTYVLVGMLLQGDMVQRLFDVREIKRANPTILIGNIVGAVAGGLLVGPLIAYMGTTADLLLFCCAIIPVGLALELSTIHRFPVLRTHPARRSSTRTPSTLSLRQALKHKYIALVLLYGVLYVLMFRLLTYLFMSSAHQLTDSADDLSHLLGICTAVGKAGSFLFVLLVSTRILRRFGLGTSLAGSPLIIGPLILVSVTAAVVGGDSHPTVLWLIVGSYLLGHTLDSGTTLTALRACLQALPLSHRTTADTAASGLGKAVADALAGSLILLLDALHDSARMAIMILIVVVGAAWVLTSRLIARDYAKLLLQALKKRSLRSATVETSDPQTFLVLEECLRGPHSPHRTFALDLLRDTHHPSYVPKVLEFAGSEDDSIAIPALARIESERIHAGCAMLEEQMALDLQPSRRAALLGGYAALLEVDAIRNVIPWLDSPSIEVKRAAYTALLKHCGIGGAIEVGRRLTSHYRDEDPDMRRFAAEVMEQVGDPGLYGYLQVLLADSDRSVQIRALLAARRVRHARLVPTVASQLADLELRPFAIRALTAADECLLPHLAESLESSNLPTLQVVWLLRAITAKGDARFIRLLKQHLHHPVEEIRQQILKTLVKLGYTAHGPEVDDIRLAITSEVGAGFHVLQAELALEQGPEFASLRRALEHEGFLRRERVSLLLAFLADPSLILRAGDALLHGSAAERSVALETLDLHLPHDLRSWVLPFLNVGETAKSRGTKLAAHFPHATGASKRITLADIIANRDGQWTYTWTRIWAIHSIAWPIARRVLASHRGEWGYAWAKVWAGNSTSPSINASKVDARPDWSNEAAAIRTCLLDHDPTLQAIAEWSLQICEADRHSDTSAQNPRAIWLEGQLPMMITLEKLSILQQTELFQETPDHALLSLAEIAEEMDTHAGETFMRQGTPSDAIFIVVSGQVRVHIDSTTIDNFGPFACIGLPALVESVNRTTSATSTEDSVLLRISKAGFDEVLAEQPEVARATMKILARHVLRSAQRAAQLPPPGKP